MCVECYFCGKKVATVEQAVAEHWVPSFMRPGDEDETNEPVCLQCSEENLDWDDEVGFVLAVEEDVILGKRVPRAAKGK